MIWFSTKFAHSVFASQKATSVSSFHDHFWFFLVRKLRCESGFSSSGTDFEIHRARPKKLSSSLGFFGVGKSLIFCMVTESGVIVT